MGSAFVGRLVAAVRQSTPPSLLANVTNTMSQSGLAALERASLCNAAVSGGTQDVEYRLEIQEGSVIGASHVGVCVTLLVHRSGFEQYILASSLDPSPLDCDVASSMHKTARVTFSGSGEVDVIDYLEEIKIIHDGQILPAESFQDAIPCAETRVQKVVQFWPVSWLWLPWRRARQCVKQTCGCRKRCGWQAQQARTGQDGEPY